MAHIVLDFPDPDQPSGRTADRVVFRDPIEVVTAGSLDEVRPALEHVAAATDRGLHAVGYLAYETAPAFDPAMRVRAGGRMPLLWFGLFPAPAGTGAGAGVAVEGGPSSHEALEWRLELDAAGHAEAVAAVRAAIAAGRTYQVNLTARMRASVRGVRGDAWSLYDGLRRAQGSGYHAFLDLGRHVILSASPELFFRTRGRHILTRPMKGTRRRGRWPEEDRALAEALRRSEKDRAESLMIVDLLRNDLGRICDTGSVHVPRLHDVERYRTVWQMTSTIQGRLREGVRLGDILTALFPCGSVTGAPKISTMREIARLERSPREVYCGAIGWVRPGGDAVFNVPIRTGWLDREAGRMEYGTGGGVVWDSTPAGEYDELRAKAVVIREPWPPVALLETLGLHHGRYRRRARHFRRIRESAAYFDFPDPTAAFQRALDDLADRHPTGRFLARVAFHHDGTADARARPLDRDGHGRDDDGPPAVVVLATTPVDSSDRFLFHKTTHRAAYDARRDAAPDHVFDVLLHNERGELTEFTCGNLVAEIDGRLLTPPREAGLLAGCLRQELLEEGAIAEAVLRVSDLERATRLFFINSARGRIEVTLAGAPEPRAEGAGYAGR